MRLAVYAANGISPNFVQNDPERADVANHSLLAGVARLSFSSPRIWGFQGGIPLASCISRRSLVQGLCPENQSILCRDANLLGGSAAEPMLIAQCSTSLLQGSKQRALHKGQSSKAGA